MHLKQESFYKPTILIDLIFLEESTPILLGCLSFSPKQKSKPYTINYTFFKQVSFAEWFGSSQIYLNYFKNTLFFSVVKSVNTNILQANA